MEKKQDGGVVGSYRRFGDAGPVYQVLSVSSDNSQPVAEVKVQDTGEVARVALEHVLADPEA